MARRGERIGDAYVRIHADGSGIDREIRDDFGKLDPVMRDLGEDHTAEYDKGRIDGLKKNRKVVAAEVMRGFEAGFGDLDARMSRITKVMREKMRSGLWEHFGDEVGERVFRDLERNLMRGTLSPDVITSLFPDPERVEKLAAEYRDRMEAELRRNKFEEILSDLNDNEGAAKARFNSYKVQEELRVKLAKKVAAKIAEIEEQQSRDREKGVALLQRLRVKAMEDLLKDEERFAAEREKKQREDRDKEFDLRIKALRDMYDEAYMMNAKFNEALGRQARDRDRQFDLTIAGFRRLEGSIDSFEDRVSRIARGQGDFGDTIRKLRRDLEEIHEAILDTNTSMGISEEHVERLRRQYVHMRVELIRTHPTLDRTRRMWDGVSDAVGRFSGRGSRNNFLNFVGSTTRNLTRLFGAITIGTARTTVSFGRFVKAIPEFFTDPKMFAEGFKIVAQGLTNIIPTLIATAAAVVLLSSAAGVLAAALSGLAAILTMLGGTIWMGIIGAMAPLLGIVAPLAASIGVVAGAILTLSDAQKEYMKETARPLVDTFRDLGKSAGDILFTDLEGWIEDADTVMKRFKPTVEGVAAALRDVVTQSLDDAAKSPGFKRFQNRFEKFLPKAVTRLGNSISSTLGGLGGVFTAMIPQANRFLKWLEGITAEFSEWANSAEGQEELKDFFEDAGDAAAALGEFLGQALEALTALFREGAKQGGNDMFSNWAEDMREFVTWVSSPKGQESLDRWLTWGRDLAEDIGEIVREVRDLYETLDSPENRKMLQEFLGFFEKAIVAANALAGILNSLGINPMILVMPILGIIDLLKTAFGGIKEMFSNMFSPLATASEWINSIQVSISMFLQTRVPDIFGGLIERIRTVWFLIQNLPALIRNIPFVDNIFSFVEQAVARVRAAISALIGLIPGIPTPPQIFAGLQAAVETLVTWVGDLIDDLADILPIPNIFSAMAAGAETVYNWVMRLIDAIPDIPRLPGIPGAGGGIPFIPGVATGGVFGQITNGPMLRWVGEDGPEAIVPLDRSLSRVDPSVRALSAIAQGKVPGMAAGGVSSKQIVVPEINVYTPVNDPRAVAQELLNHIAGSGY